MDDLLTDFIAETRDTLDAIAGELVAWEADPADRARLDSIFRFVHTVKGSCGFLDLPRLARLSHAAEDVLAEVRAGKRRPDAPLVSGVLAVIDRIAELTDAMASGDPLPDGEDSLLILALAETPEGEGPATGVPTAKPLPSRTLARSIRLPVDLLDRMMAGVSDMVLARNELSRALREAGAGASAELAFERLSLCVAEIRDAITRTRMARIDGLFGTLPRMVRDLSAQLGRQVQLEIDGGDVELDREMIEMIRDPLTHIVRNALDHGIEPPHDRIAAGKPALGRLRIAARQSGNQILIDAIDDGRGIDAESVGRKAIAAGIATPEQVAQMSWARKLDLIFTPGLSTAAAVSDISGRGVGMDVVRANVERIGGAVEVESRLGQGVRLTLRVPLTLTIIPALIVSCGEHGFAVPRSAIDEIVRPRGDAVRLERLGNAAVASIRGRSLPVIDLGVFLGEAETGTDQLPPLLLVMRAGGGEQFALAVDAVLADEDLVVKPAAPAVMATGIYAGTTLPDNSRPILLLDVAGIAAVAGIRAPAADPEEEKLEETPVAETQPTLLFRDFDGAERGVRLALVERIEDVARAAIAETGGRLHLSHQDMLVPVIAAGALPQAGSLRLLQLGDGDLRLAYAIDEVIDIVELPARITPAVAPGPVAGVTLFEGRQVELLDAHWLFAGVASGPRGHSAPLCLIAGGDEAWSRQVLGPLLAASGYRVAFGGEGGEPADVVIVADQPEVAGDFAAPVVRLRTAPAPAAANDGSVWRYDRAGLLDALRMAADRRR